MKVIIKKPFEKQKAIEVENLELKSIYELVECDTVERITFGILKSNNIDMLLDEEGKLTDKDPNIALRKGFDVVDVMVGNVLFVGVDGDKWVSLNDVQTKIVNGLLNAHMTLHLIDEMPRKISNIYL